MEKYFMLNKNYYWAKDKVFLSLTGNTFKPKRKYFWAKEEILLSQGSQCEDRGSFERAGNFMHVCLQCRCCNPGFKEEVDKMLQPKGKPSQKKYPFFWVSPKLPGPFIQEFKEGFSEKKLIWFSENEGRGGKGRLEFSRNFIQFGTVTRRPYWQYK